VGLILENPDTSLYNIEWLKDFVTTIAYADFHSSSQALDIGRGSLRDDSACGPLPVEDV
jgi:hypothetical protein